MYEPKLEHWWVTKCKSPDYQGNILLAKNADVLPYRHPLEELPFDAPIHEWEESCPYCKRTHLYNKKDVFSREVDINLYGRGTSAFLRAWGTESPGYSSAVTSTLKSSDARSVQSET